MADRAHRAEARRGAMPSPGIAVVTGGFPRPSEPFLLRELLDLEARGDLAGIFATGPGEAGPVQPGCEQLRDHVTILPKSDCAAQATELASRLAGLGVRGVHACFAHEAAEVAAHAARLLRVPFGMTVHTRDLRRVNPATLAARLRRATCVLACNEYVATRLEALGVRAPVIHHGVDMVRFRPRTAPRSQALNLLAVGSFVPRKGFDVLIEAAARLQIAFSLRVVGEGPERAAMEQAIATHGLWDRVELLGPATHAELPRQYARAHVVVVPSVEDEREQDGLPGIVLEAMASGRAVVASDVGAIRSAVAHGRTGLLVTPGDPANLARAIETLARFPLLRQRFNRSARARALRHFELSRCNTRLHRALVRAYG